MKFFRSYLLTLIFILAITGCTRKKLDNNTFNINLSTEPPTLDWNIATDTTSSLCLNNLMDGLVEFNWDTPEISVKPALAESWSVSADASVYTFKIRQGVQWTDGKPLVAQQFVDSWRRLVDPKTASEYAYFIFDVKNAQDINAGKLPTSQLGIDALDDHTLRITLNKPASYFLFIPTHPPTYPIRLDIIEKYGTDKWTEAGNIVTIGPFKLKDWEHDKKLTMERNDNYWGPKTKIKTIVGRMVNASSTALSLFETGALDFTQEIPALDLKRYQTDSKLIPSLMTGPEFSNYYYGFNTKKAPFDNANVRKAFSAAVNREELIKTIRHDYYPLTSWIPVGMSGYEPNIGIKFDPEKAKEYMIKAGYKQVDGKWVNKSTGAPFPRVEMAFNTNEAHSIIAQNLQTQWRKNLGVEPVLLNQEWKVYLKTLNSNTPQLWRLGWQADYPDPDNFMALFYSFSTQNNTKWGNPEYDKLVQKAASEMDLDVRKALYDKAQKILTEEDVAIIPIYTSKSYSLMKPYVMGYKKNPMKQFRFSETWLEREKYKN